MVLAKSAIDAKAGVATSDRVSAFTISIADATAPVSYTHLTLPTNREV